jgi:DNA-binding CsgD family transcriptional regulator
VDVQVTDTGLGTAAGSCDGRGWHGMRERAAVYDGTLRAGPAPSGGWRVAAHLPARRRGRRPGPPAGRPDRLGTRALQAIAHGWTNSEIADRLQLAESTVKTHVGHILAKIDARDRVQAVIFAYDTRLVRPA